MVNRLRNNKGQFVKIDHVIQNCVQCGKVFKGKVNQRFCSQSCFGRWLWQEKRPTLIVGIKRSWKDPDTRARRLAGCAIGNAKKRGRKQPRELVERQRASLKKFHQEHPERKIQHVQLGKNLAASPFHYHRQIGEFTLSLESREKISKTLKERLKVDTHLKSIYLEGLRKGRESLRERRGQTKPEAAMEEVLRALGLHFEREYSIGAYFMDFGLIELKIAILVDGCYWHCCPLHFASPTTKAQIHNLIFDRKREKALKKVGWHSVHIWEHELVKSKMVQLRIQEEVSLANEGITNKHDGL